MGATLTESQFEESCLKKNLLIEVTLCYGNPKFLKEWLQAVLSLLHKASKIYDEGTQILLLMGYLSHILCPGIKLHSFCFKVGLPTMVGGIYRPCASALGYIFYQEIIEDIKVRQPLRATPPCLLLFHSELNLFRGLLQIFGISILQDRHQNHSHFPHH